MYYSVRCGYWERDLPLTEAEPGERVGTKLGMGLWSDSKNMLGEVECLDLLTGEWRTVDVGIPESLSGGALMTMVADTCLSGVVITRGIISGSWWCIHCVTGLTRGVTHISHQGGQIGIPLRYRAG